jgi:hypothetical protein
MEAVVPAGPVMALDARAFPTSNTLLQKLQKELHAQGTGAGSAGFTTLAAAGEKEQASKCPAGVGGPQAKEQSALNTARLHPGLVVEDTAEWMNRPSNPSRDVCMMLVQRPSSSSAVGSSHSVTPTTFVPARSLVLLGFDVTQPMEQRAASAVLGLYVVFPTRLPQSLLAAVRDSCNRLLATVRGAHGRANWFVSIAHGCSVCHVRCGGPMRTQRGFAIQIVGLLPVPCAPPIRVSWHTQPLSYPP